MGNSESENAKPVSKSQFENNPNLPQLKYIFNEIDKFYVTELSKEQFMNQLFVEIQKTENRTFSNLKVSNTFLVERLYMLLTQNQKLRGVNCKQLRDFMQTIYTNPQKAIEKSFELLDFNGDKYISDAQFLSYMDNSFINLFAIAEKDILDSHYKVTLREWVSKNKKAMYDQILAIFHSFKRTDPQKWHYNDFKRWILSGQNWTLDICIGINVYKTPLNLLCLFNIPKPI